MPNLQVVSRTRHANQRWQRPASYAFAAQDAVAALVALELPKAMMFMPIAFFVAQGGFLPVAVLGLRSGENLFVASGGRWVGGYIPSVYRAYPFALSEGADGQSLLCVDEDSGLVTNANTPGTTAFGEPAAGEAFFAEDDAVGQDNVDTATPSNVKPSKSVAQVLGFLNQVASSRQATQRICAVLQKHALIQPWLIKMQTEAGEQNVEGLYRIDEAALNQLPPEAFQDLRAAGALPVAYCQLLSMQHLPMLGQLAQAHAKAAQAKVDPTPKLPVSPSGDLDLEFLNQNGTMSFSNLFG